MNKRNALKRYVWIFTVKISWENFPVSFYKKLARLESISWIITPTFQILALDNNKNRMESHFPYILKWSRNTSENIIIYSQHFAAKWVSRFVISCMWVIICRTITVMFVCKSLTEENLVRLSYSYQQCLLKVQLKVRIRSQLSFLVA